MTLSIQEVVEQIDYLVDCTTGQFKYPQTVEAENENIWFDNDDGTFYKSFTPDTPVESTADGLLLIDGKAYRAYVAQQVKFPITDS